MEQSQANESHPRRRKGEPRPEQPTLSRIGAQGDLGVGEGWQLLTIRGIPLRIHPSWFVILALATLAFQQQYSEELAGHSGDPLLWALGFLTAVLLFVSVLLHELGHSVAAISQGVKVRSITLFLLGGVASVERECSTPEGAFLVAAAGPARPSAPAARLGFAQPIASLADRAVLRRAARRYSRSSSVAVVVASEAQVREAKVAMEE